MLESAVRIVLVVATSCVLTVSLAGGSTITVSLDLQAANARIAAAAKNICFIRLDLRKRNDA